MTSAASLQSCHRCPKGTGQVICGGCQQWFCLKHLLEHRQELSQQMNLLTHEHNQLQQNLALDDNDRQHPLMKRIDQWELNSIAKIKQAADKARQQLRKPIRRSKRNIAKLLRPITDQLQANRKTEAFTEIDLERWTRQLNELSEKFSNPPTVEIKYDQPGVSLDNYFPFVQLRILQKDKVPELISNEIEWSVNGQTVAGGQGQGAALNQLNSPFSLDIDDDGTSIIVDTNNHRIMRWKPNADKGEIIAGGKGPGSQIDQLNQPLAMLIDRVNDCLTISDWGNQRVMRWPLNRHEYDFCVPQIIVSRVKCFGLALDDEGFLYISDYENHEVRRYGSGDKKGVIVAGGQGQGDGLKQLHHPRTIFVDDDQTIYVSDTDNHRVMKWTKNAKEGIVVAGGQGQGSSLRQLSLPCGIFVDRMGSIYIDDQGNDRVMRWLKDATEGQVIVGGNGRGSQNHQFTLPTSISVDDDGNLYVIDRDNHRIQRFKPGRG